MLFSEAFDIEIDGSEPWFDPILHIDTKLFIDPFLIFQNQLAPSMVPIKNLWNCIRLHLNWSQKQLVIDHRVTGKRRLAFSGHLRFRNSVSDTLHMAQPEVGKAKGEQVLSQSPSKGLSLSV